MSTPLRAIALCLFFVFTAAAFAASPPQTLPRVAERYLAPDFTLKTEDGKPWRLADQRGKVIVLNFWATWCPPCRDEMPSMERARKAVESDGIVIIAVNVGEDADTIFEFTGRYPVSFPLLMDHDASIIKKYKVIGLPTTFVIDPAGYVTHRVVGGREWDDPALLEALRGL
jgi:peroxiredoxin